MIHASRARWGGAIQLGCIVSLLAAPQPQLREGLMNTRSFLLRRFKNIFAKKCMDTFSSIKLLHPLRDYHVLPNLSN